MKVYTYNETLELLRGVVAERGEDYIYQSPRIARSAGPNCAYAVSVNGVLQASCGVGMVLAEVGVPLELMEYDYEADSGAKYALYGASHNLRDIASDGVVGFDRMSVALLEGFQVMQDDGYPWGKALAAGIRAAVNAALADLA